MDNSSAQIVVIPAESKTAKTFHDQAQMAETWTQKNLPTQNRQKPFENNDMKVEKVAGFSDLGVNGSFHVQTPIYWYFKLVVNELTLKLV